MTQSKGITTTEEQQRRLFRQHCLRFVLLCVGLCFDVSSPSRGFGVCIFGNDDLAGRRKEYVQRRFNGI